MIFFKLLIFIISLAYHSSKGAEETPHKNQDESFYLSLCQVIEKIEKAAKTPNESIQNWPGKGRQKEEDCLALLPEEILGKALSGVINYRDQLVLLMCSKKCQNYASLFTKTHINNLTSPTKETAQILHSFISLLTNLKYLCITQSNIGNVDFKSKNLKGLTIRDTIVNSNLLLSQNFLQYLDVRTSSLEKLISADVLQTTLKSNLSLVVLKVHITPKQNGGEPESIYQNVPQLKSIEFVDINNDLAHLNHLSMLKHVHEIILSSFETGRLETHYKEALKIIYQKISLNGLTVKIKCIKDSEQWQITHTDVTFTKLISLF
jgi:hypothetical protein